MVKIIKSSFCRTGYQVQLDFVITQHLRDEELLNSFIPYLNCGKLIKAKRGEDVQIFDIEAKASGVSVILKKVSPVMIELTN